MTTQDEELFELCKQVHEDTGWDKTDLNYYPGNHSFFVIDTSKNAPRHLKKLAPLYNSDYLLEKLPFPSHIGRDSFAWIAKWERGAGSSPFRQIWERADTPLKALLKLTLSLKQAGELK